MQDDSGEYPRPEVDDKALIIRPNKRFLKEDDSISLENLGIEGAERLSQEVLEQIESEKDDSYYKLIPDEYRDHVDLLVKENIQLYWERHQAKRGELSKDEFEELFREEMARNWLGKVRLYERVVDRMGFIRITGDPEE